MNNEEFDSLESLDFSKLKNKRTKEENEERIKSLIQYADIYKIGKFRESCRKIKSNIESEVVVLSKKTELSAAFLQHLKDIQAEEKVKDDFSFEKYYSSFLSKKRALNDK